MLITDPSLEMTEPYILIVPTYDAAVLALIQEFVEYQDNQKHLVGVAGSGNKAFGGDYIWTAKQIASEYGVPLVFDFEFRGTSQDIIMFKREVELIAESKTTTKA